MACRAGLDTLGGYFTYHNLILITMFLAVYAVAQGAKSVRGIEERGMTDLVLAAGISRTRLLAARSVGFAVLLALISAGIAGGTAIAFVLAGEDLGPFEFVQVLSPFFYTNLSRALVPGMEAHWPSMAGLIVVAVIAIAASAWFFERRDLGSAYGVRRPHRHRHAAPARSRAVGSLWADGLVHGWVSIVV